MEDYGGVEVEDCGDDEDIYGDLESDIFLDYAKRPRIDDVTQQEEYKNLLNESQTLKRSVKQLQKDNRTLVTNMESLLLTAKNQIEKKSFIIKNLAEKLKQVTKSKSKLSEKEAEEILVQCQEALQDAESEVTLNEIKNCLKNAYSDSTGKRKLIKFGNMSLYFFREQGSFQREETVDIPKTSSDVAQSSIADAEERSKNTKSSHTETNDQKCNLLMNRLEETSYDSHNNPKNLSNPPPLINISHQYGMYDSNTNESKGMSESTREPENKRQRISDKEVKRLEHDRDKQVNNNNKRRSSDKQSNNNKHSKARDVSPSNDRYRHRRGDDSNNTRSGRNYGSFDRKSDNFRQQSSWRKQDTRPIPTKRFLTDSKYSKSTNGKHRSRSRSK